MDGPTDDRQEKLQEVFENSSGAVMDRLQRNVKKKERKKRKG